MVHEVLWTNEFQNPKLKYKKNHEEGYACVAEYMYQHVEIGGLWQSTKQLNKGILYKNGTSMHGSWLSKEGYMSKITLDDACISDMANLFFLSVEKYVTLTSRKHVYTLM